MSLVSRAEAGRFGRWSVALMCACGLVVSACGSSDTDAGGTGTSTSADANGAKFADGTKLAALVHFQQPYTQEILDGAKAAASDTGADLQTGGPSNVDPNAHVKLFQDAIAAGAKGVVTIAFPPDLWVRPIERAVQQGVPVNTFDIASPDSDEGVHVGPSHKEIGQKIADAIVKDLGADATGTVVAGICVPGFSALETRAASFKSTLTAEAPGLTIKGPLDVTADPTKNLATWQQLRRQNPDAKAFVGFCSLDLPNLVKMKEKEPGATYGIYGTDLEPDTLRGIKDGLVTATFGQKPFVEGYLGTWITADMVARHKKYKGWIDVGVEEVTKDNVDAVMAREASLKDGFQDSLKYYKSEIDKITSDPAANLKPISELGQ